LRLLDGAILNPCQISLAKSEIRQGIQRRIRIGKPVIEVCHFLFLFSFR
jgi:hypothetical protein